MSLTLPNLPPAAALDACWSRIGVWGDGQCPQLQEFIHCRNCPAYSTAAARMLDGEPPAEYARQWAAHFAGRKAEVCSATSPVLIFRVAAEWLALPVGVLVELVSRRPVVSLPHARNPFIKGLVNIRGQLLVCVSLSRLLQLGSRTAQEKARHSAFERLLVVESDEGRLVFPVSEVFGLGRHAAGDLKPVPATVECAGASFARAVLPWRILRRAEKGMPAEDVSVGLLDEVRLFQHINRNLS